jgi:hypothetical protein
MEVLTLSGNEVCVINGPAFVRRRGVVVDGLVVDDLVALLAEVGSSSGSLLGRQASGPESAVQVSDELHATSATAAVVMASSASSSHGVMAAAACLYRWWRAGPR